MSFRAERPQADEHSPYYARYVAQVPDGDVVETLVRQNRSTLEQLRALSEAQGARRYAEGKWSVREVIGHLSDSERVFAYRAMRFARNDETELPGFDENAFVANATFDSRTLASLADEFEAVRAGTAAFFASLTHDEWGRSGTANKARISVRALAWIVAGHELHHLNILQTRYL